jgi:hypothetical protein
MGSNRGNHAGDWEKGQTVKVCVDTPPAVGGNITIPEDEFWEAVHEAMAEWNDAQGAFGGLTLEVATSDCDVQVSWEEKSASWGSVSPDTDPVPVTMESNDGLNSKGLTRVLKHEFGHVEGLGHSGDSVIMKWNYPSDTDDKAAKAEDWNDEGPLETPNEDDLGLKKELYATVDEKASKSVVSSNATQDKSGNWVYSYRLRALEGPGYSDPVTRFTAAFSPEMKKADIEVLQLPEGWMPVFVPGEPSDRGSGEGKPTDVTEGLMPAIMSFRAESPEFGVFPGQEVFFEIASDNAPVPGQADTNSPGFDRDEFVIDVPGTEPKGALPTWAMALIVILILTTVLFFALWRGARGTQSTISEPKQN